MKKPEIPADIVQECLSAGLLSAIFSSPRGTGQIRKIKIRPVELKTGFRFQLEQFEGQKVFHRNVETSELENLMITWLSGDFSRAEISTRAALLHVLANRRGELSVIRKNTPGVSEQAAHNRTKNYILEEGIPVPFLVDLGVMTKEGAVIAAKHDKFRQINRFLEFIADILPALREAAAEGNPANPREISVVDFGCGKSYLTFAVYYYLSVLQKLPVRITGLDLKEDVIRNCSVLAEKYGYTGLTFLVGDIADYTGTDSADMVISLHACDTVTDLALARAVHWNARVILSVPCCQHELNGQLSGKENTSPGRTILEPAFRHGIIRERMAALFTDALRAELLESRGYTVQILEFIDMSHTPKNLLIRAVRSGQKTGNNERAEYRTLRDFLGASPTLEKELG